MFDELAYAYNKPKSFGQIKASPEDFAVDEDLGFNLTGEGEHLCLQIEKTLLNTEEMAKQIAKVSGVSSRSVSYAGLKDKYAKTTQWFSIHLPGKPDPDLTSLNGENVRILTTKRHNKKLKIGALKSNHFTIKVSALRADIEDLEMRIATIKLQGVPNYYGPQRFGHQGSNLAGAKSLLLESKKVKNPHIRGIYYSAARSFLFNQIVNLRVQEQCWNRPVDGDLMMLAGTHSVFAIDQVDDALFDRVAKHDLFPAAVLWGEGKERADADALVLQNKALAEWGDWCQGLERQRVAKAYRSMVLLPENMRFEADSFSFTLPKGAFATTVLRELLNV